MKAPADALVTPEASRDVPADGIFIERLQLGGAGPKVAVKDSIDVAGVPTRLGSACFADARPAREHAAVVAAVLAAGCCIVGKTSLHELAYGLTGVNAWSGTPLNPRAPDRVPGGSSSGSAVAVAAGLVDFALATDTGGSIRIPSACCGIYGLKPTYGRVSRGGVHPRVSTLDCVGPIAADAAMLEKAMAAIDPSFAPAPQPRSATVGWVDVEATSQVRQAARDVLARAGLPVRPVTLPSFAAAFVAGLAIIGAETWAAYGHLVERPELGEDVRVRLFKSRDITAEQLRAAETVRLQFRSEVDAALGEVGALALPTLPDVPLTLAAAADPGAALGSSALVRPFNLSGHPALTLPVSAAGLPAGLQLVGRAQDDAALCALARHLAGEAAHG